MSIKMIAHRGLSRLAPENTLPAYELGGQYGYFGAECDVQETLDGAFVLMHDDTINRTTNGTGNVSDYTLKELKHCLIDSDIFSDTRIPTLTEYLQTCKRHGVTPVIEVKKISPTSSLRLLKVIQQWFKSENVIVISFHENVLVQLRKLDSHLKLQWIAPLNEKNIAFCALYGMDIDTSHTHVEEELIQKAHAAGVLVNVWTVNDGLLLQKLIKMGVDFITTDYLMHHQLVHQAQSTHHTLPDKEYKGKDILTFTIPNLKVGDALTISYWCRHLNQTPLLATVKDKKGKAVLQGKSTPQPGWEFVELQGVITKEAQIFTLEAEKTAHGFIRQLRIHVQHL